MNPATGEVTAKAIPIETQGVASLRTAALEMEAVASQCRRLRAPADYHLVVSWHEHEHPTPEQAFAAGRHALAALGMESHQYIMAVWRAPRKLKRRIKVAKQDHYGNHDFLGR